MRQLLALGKKVVQEKKCNLSILFGSVLDCIYVVIFFDSRFVESMM